MDTAKAALSATKLALQPLQTVKGGQLCLPLVYFGLRLVRFPRLSHRRRLAGMGADFHPRTSRTIIARSRERSRKEPQSAAPGCIPRNKAGLPRLSKSLLLIPRHTCPTNTWS